MKLRIGATAAYAEQDEQMSRLTADDKLAFLLVAEDRRVTKQR